MINQISLLGNLGQDPEVRFSAAGNAVTTISIGYKGTKDKGGSYKNGWIKVVCFKEVAESVGALLKKGDRVLVTGKLDPNNWTNDKGEEIKQIQIVADMISKEVKTKKNNSNTVTSETNTNSDLSDFPNIPF